MGYLGGGGGGVGGGVSQGCGCMQGLQPVCLLLGLGTRLGHGMGHRWVQFGSWGCSWGWVLGPWSLGRPHRKFPAEWSQAACGCFSAISWWIWVIQVATDHTHIKGQLRMQWHGQHCSHLAAAGVEAVRQWDCWMGTTMTPPPSDGHSCFPCPLPLTASHKGGEHAPLMACPHTWLLEVWQAHCFATRFSPKPLAFWATPQTPMPKPHLEMAQGPTPYNVMVIYKMVVSYESKP